MERYRALKVYWCPCCEVQSERPWHLCKPAAPLFPQTAEETKCEEVEVVRATDHQGAVEAFTRYGQHDLACTARVIGADRCSCGFRETVARLSTTGGR